MKLRSLLIPAALFVASPAPAALIAAWNMDQTSGALVDSTGGSAPAVLTGTAGYGTQGVPNGTYGAISVVNGAGTSISFGPSTSDTLFISGSDNNNPVLNLAPTSSFTAMGWIRPAEPTLTTSFTYRLIATGTSAGAGGGWGLGLRYTIASGVTTNTVRLTAYAVADKDSTAVSITTGQWYHLAASYSNGTTLFYLNGVLVSTATNTAPFNAETTDGRLLIGGRLGGTDLDQASGLLDGLRVYDTALTAGEIAAAAAASVSAVPEPSSGLLLGALAAPALLRRRRRI